MDAASAGSLPQRRSPWLCCHRGVEARIEIAGKVPHQGRITVQRARPASRAVMSNLLREGVSSVAEARAERGTRPSIESDFCNGIEV